MIIWGISVIFLWFRPKIEFIWKIITFLIFAFYAWFFSEEITKGLIEFKADWFSSIMIFLKEIIFVIFYLLFIIWPIFLIIIFYKADDFGAERMLKFICIFTVILWIIIVSYVFYQKGIDEFLFQKFKTVIPFVK